MCLSSLNWARVVSWKLVGHDKPIRVVHQTPCPRLDLEQLEWQCQPDGVIDGAVTLQQVLVGCGQERQPFIVDVLLLDDWNCAGRGCEPKLVERSGKFRDRHGPGIRVLRRSFQVRFRAQDPWQPGGAKHANPWAM